MSDWKPWYERMAEIDSAQERDDYARSTFSVGGGFNGGPKGISAGDVAFAGLVGALFYAAFRKDETRLTRSERKSIQAEVYPLLDQIERAYVEHGQEWAAVFGPTDSRTVRLSNLHQEFRRLERDFKSALDNRDALRADSLGTAIDANRANAVALVELAEGQWREQQATNERVRLEGQVDELLQDSLAQLAKIEPQCRLVFMQIEQHLEQSGESGTTRMRRFDQICGALDAAFDDLREAIVKQKINRAQRVISERIQPALAEVKQLFPDA